jgi:hypothetical protein
MVVIAIFFFSPFLRVGFLHFFSFVSFFLSIDMLLDLESYLNSIELGLC